MNDERTKKEVKKYFAQIQQSLAEQALDTFFCERGLTREHQKLFYAFLKVWQQPRTEASIKIFQSGNKLLDRPGLVKQPILEIREELKRQLPEDERKKKSNWIFLSTDYAHLAKLWKDLRNAGLIWKESPRIESEEVKWLYKGVKFDKRKKQLPVYVMPRLSVKEHFKSEPGLFLLKPIPTQLSWKEVETLLRCNLFSPEIITEEQVNHYFRDALWLFSEEEIQAHLSSRQQNQVK